MFAKLFLKARYQDLSRVHLFAASCNLVVTEQDKLYLQTSLQLLQLWNLCVLPGNLLQGWWAKFRGMLECCGDL